MPTTGRSTNTARALAFVLAATPLAPLAALGAQTTPPATVTDSARLATTAAARDTTRRDSAITPVADPARGMDAELRVALYDLLGERYVPALARLDQLANQPVAMATPSTQAGALRGRQDVLFLLSQSYWRLGMDQAFRTTAEQIVSGSSGARYGGILRAQLLLDAYRHGDYARALTMAQQLSGSDIRGLAQLVAGLSNYQQGRWTEARSAFAAAQQGGAPYDQYAQYMDALAQLRGDTAQTATALASLEKVAGSASTEFAEQVRLTAAQLAYEAERYDDAARLAGAIPATSGLGAQALLVRAWALYKAGQAEAAGQAFRDFATRYPQLPERDEARLMYAQVLLQLNRTTEASQLFRQVADSARTEGGALQARTTTAMADAARALVNARAAGLLFIADPAAGKTVALADAAGSDANVLAAAVSDTVRATPKVAAPEVISLADVDARFGSMSATFTTVPKRVLYVPTSATNNRVEYAARAQALFDADASVALARYRVQAALEAQQRQLAMLQALQNRISTDTAGLNGTFRRLSAAQDSLGRLATSLDAAAIRLKQLFQGQLTAMRILAEENQQMLDSLRTAMSPALAASDREMLDTEVSTARIYRQVADEVAGGLDRAVGNHPVFAMRDSARARGERSRLALTQAQSAMAGALSALGSEITRLQGTDGAGTYRAALASAEATRTTAEGQMVAIVTRELDARATELLASLRRDTEAAEFGSASASFFQALEASGRAPAPNAPTGTSGAGGGTTGAAGAQSAPATTTTSRPKQ